MIGWLGILNEKLNAEIWHGFKNPCIKVWQMDQIIIISKFLAHDNDFPAFWLVP